MLIQIPRLLITKLSDNPELHSVAIGTVDRFSKAFAHSGTPFFRSYTDHGPQHISEVLESCSRLITKSSWTVFTPADATILILATLLHDAALYLQEAGFIELINGSRTRSIPGFDTSTWSELWERYRGEASRFDRRKLRDLLGTEEPVEPPELERPESWTQLQLDYVGEFLRRHHPRMAHEIAIFGLPGERGSALRILETDPAIADLAGLTARSHGVPLRDCLPYLGARYHLQDFQGMHAVFLMGVLRIADYLQIQAGRAPKEVLQIKTLRSPTSRREWNVHHAIRNITYNDPDPEAIRIQLESSKTDLETFLRLRDWLGGIQSELDTTWAVFGEVYGRYIESGLHHLGLMVRRIRSDLDDINAFGEGVNYIPELVRFTASDAELLQLLLQPLYGDHPSIGIRELVQNSVDALAELCVYRRQHSIVPAAQQEDLGEQGVIVEIDEAAQTVRVTDVGIGMTPSTVRDYFVKAGATFRRSDYWKSEFEDEAGRSKVLRSGRFGVGALAAFLLGHKIDVTTRHVSAAKGITFSTDLMAEKIELKRVECPVGTSVVVHVNARTLERLRKSNWDWFCLSEPKVTRMWVVEGERIELDQARQFAACGQPLPNDWRRLPNTGFADLQWTYSEAPRIVCNGIEVRELRSEPPSIVSTLRIESTLDEAWCEKLFRYPRLSVFDSNSSFPLTLTRDRVAAATLPFDRDLALEVVRDFVAFCIAVAPEIPPVASGRKSQNHTIEYPGFARERRRRRFREQPYWVQTRKGTIPGDGFLLRGLNVHSIFLHSFPLATNVPEWHDLVTALPQMPLMFGQDRGRRYDELRDVLYGWETSCNTGFNPIRFEGIRLLIEARFADSWNRRGALQARIRKKLVEEWRTKEWVVWRMGKCTTPSVDLKRIASHATHKLAYRDIVCAEKFITRTRHRDPIAGVTQVWSDLVGNNSIPYSQKKRRTVLKKAFAAVGDYIERWQETIREQEAARAAASRRRASMTDRIRLLNPESN
jgi:histidine kinase/DNA gyrase B/HSP90-like ATPase